MKERLSVDICTKILCVSYFKVFVHPTTVDSNLEKQDNAWSVSFKFNIFLLSVLGKIPLSICLLREYSDISFSPWLC